MSMRFDATVKDLARSHVVDYAVQFRLDGPSPIALLNVDLSTITAAADLILGHGDPPRSVVVVHFQANRDDNLERRIVLYNGVAYYRYQVPVHNLVVLLRPSANDPALDDGIHFAVWPERGRTDQSFEVVRMWQQPVHGFLTGGLGTLPLVPLCQMPEGLTLEQALPELLRQIEERLVREAAPDERKRLLAATFVLSGLRLVRGVVLQLFQGVHGMRESDTYQMILDEGRDEGRLEEVRKLLLLLGRRKFGQPNEAVRQALSNLVNLERLERMAENLIAAETWEELLSTP